MIEKKPTCLRIAVSLPVKETYSYAVPATLTSEVRVGLRVLVPFGSRQVTGYVMELIPPPDPSNLLKDVLDILDPHPLFFENMVPFFEWVSEYYLCPIGLVIKSALPGGINRQSYRTALLTEAGFLALERGGSGQAEAESLSWIRDHPGAPLPRPFHRIYGLAKKGWLRFEERAPGKGTGPLMRILVKVRKGFHSGELAEKMDGHLRARNEEAFLRKVLSHDGIWQTELCREFSNASYLIDKWSGKGVLEQVSAPVYRTPAGGIITQCAPPEILLKQQETVLLHLRERIKAHRFSACLLHGVTGSGKTEVYYRAAKETIGEGRQTILMVPEISLATYMYGLFRSRLGDRVAIYHSSLSRGERYDQWTRMARGEVDLVIGARSALWAPFPDLGLLVVDEEFDPAYKQENPPRYHARDAAVVRGKMSKAVVLLGSGTPSVQSYHNCLKGRYHLLAMPQRVENRPLPHIEMVDMKTANGSAGEERIISSRLKAALQDHLDAGNQAILFLNRRGFHRLYLCMDCGKSIRCPNCDVALTHHQEHRLKCHYCGFNIEVHSRCPSCGSGRLKPYGFGTERLASELSDLLPGVHVGRMDTDSTGRKGSAFEILKRFGAHEIDILVGTQMITKGYDFPNVTLVGVIAADLSLGFPDFRAGERTFQILTQVAGRSGRGMKKGEVIVQSFNSEHYAIKAAMAHDFKAFFEEEMSLREALGYPPFTHLACLKIKGNSKERTAEAARFLGKHMREIILGWPKRGREIRILGPVEAPISRVKGKYRWQILIKGRSMALIRHLVLAVEDPFRGVSQLKGVQLIVDVDPYQMI
ncbi:MAG: primosomal protein N' [Desulfatiglandaceae bacterium]